MGKRSVRENKNRYQVSRESAGLTRESASERLVFLSPERIEKIESGKSAPHPDEVLAMERGYMNPELCNYFCTHECPIGRKYVPEANLQDLSQVTIDLLASLNSMESEEKQLIEIVADGRITCLEQKDFSRILEKINRLYRSISGLQIWLEHAEYTGKIEPEDRNS